MNIDQVGVKEEVEVMFHEFMDNNIKTEIVKEEPNETDFPIKCEICNKNSDNENEKVCVHHQNLGRVEQKQDDKFQEPGLLLVKNLQTNSALRTDCSSSRKQEESVIKLIGADITIKEEEYLYTPEYLSIKVDFVESQTGQLKTEDDDDSFYENSKIEKFEEEPIDNDASLGSNMLVKDEISIDDVKPDFSEGSQEGHKRKIQRDSNLETDEDTEKHRSNAAEKPYRCTLCSKTFSWNSRLVSHQRTNTGEKPIQCKICSKWFSTRCQLGPHQITHIGERCFQCKICSKGFSRPSLLVTHQRTHAGERPFQCETCLRRFFSSRHLVVHQKIHTGEKTFQCTVCSKYFYKKSQLVIHEMIHTGNKQFQCPLCSKSFFQLQSLDCHKKIHHVQNQNTCKVCLQPFPDSSSLTLHYSTFHKGGNPLQCRYCSKIFTCRGYLVTHEKIHSGERPHECEICSKPFIRRCDLIRHERVHNGKKSYKCEVCSNTFFDNSTLAKHKKIHSKEKPFQCIICLKSFTVKSYLVAHQKIHERTAKSKLRHKTRNKKLKQQIQKKPCLLLGEKSENESSVEIAGAGTLKC